MPGHAFCDLPRWFKEDCAHCFNGDSKPVEFTCPEFYSSDMLRAGSKTFYALGFPLAARLEEFVESSQLRSEVVLLSLCCQCVGGLMGRLKNPVWKLTMWQGGVLTIAPRPSSLDSSAEFCPWLFFYVMEMPYMWIIVMNPLGIALCAGPYLPLWPTTPFWMLLALG